MSRIWISFLLLSSLALSLGSSCNTLDSSRLKHKESEVLAKFPAYNWAELDATESKDFLTKQAEGTEGFLPASHPSVQHLQKIVDVIDQLVRSIEGMQGRSWPKPRVAVLIDPEVNAYVSSIKLQVAQKYRPLTAEVGATDGVLNLMFSDIIFEATEGVKPFVRLKSPALWKPEEFVRLWNTRSSNAAACKFQVDKSGDILLPGQCFYEDSVKGGSTLSFDVQAPFVIVNEGLIKNFSEKAVTVFLAHELGHFYRGHSSSLSTFDPYFYEQTPENELQKPTPSNRYPDLAKALLDVKDLNGLVQPKGARYNGNISKIILNYLPMMDQWCAEPAPCTESFKALVQLTNDSSFKSKVINKVGSMPLDAEGLRLYLSAEALFLEVSEKLGKVDPQPFESLINAPGLLQLFDFSQKSVSLSSWFDAAQKKVLVHLSHVEKIYQEAAQNNLGYYSAEEEADEVAAEISARMGIARLEVLEAWFSMLNPLQDDAFGNSNQSCRALQKNAWKSPAGVKVLLGQLGDDHHSACYRAYNSDREWQVHQMDRFSPASALYKFDDEQWKSLQNAN